MNHNLFTLEREEHNTKKKTKKNNKYFWQFTKEFYFNYIQEKVHTDIAPVQLIVQMLDTINTHTHALYACVCEYLVYSVHHTQKNNCS